MREGREGGREWRCNGGRKREIERRERRSGDNGT